MKFFNKTAYIGKIEDKEPSFPQTLTFEHFIGEVAVDCVVNNKSIEQYIKDNTVDDNIRDAVKFDLYNDYIKGGDVYSEKYGWINSKSCKDRNREYGKIHIKKSDIHQRNDVKYYATIIFADNALYLVPTEKIITQERIQDDSSFDITLGDFIELAEFKLSLTPQIFIFYKNGFFKWLDPNITAEEKVKNIKEYFINFNNRYINNIEEISFNSSEIKNF